MAFVVKDRVKQSTTTTGTGSIVLNGTVSGFQTFANALSDGDTTYYSLFEVSTNNWEVGVGTWTESTTTLARTTILASSNSGSAVNLTAQAEVFIAQPAGKAAFFDPSGDLTLVQDPTSNLQAATKQYVDTIAAAGLHYHDPVRVEQEGNLSATYSNGTAGVGATLTNNSTQAALTIDGVALSLNDRVLIYEQTNGYENGIYTVTNVGSASTNWVLTRATDADSYAPSDPDSLGQGDAFFVLEGTAGAGELYVMNTEGTITFGTTNITFTQVAATAVYTAGTGLTLTGTEFSADGANITNVDAVTLDGIDSSQFLRSDVVDTKTAGNLNFSDNVKAQFGAGSDLQIYHDGTDSRIREQGTGGLIVLGNTFVSLRDTSTGGRMLEGTSSGATTVYYNGNAKLATTSTGIDVTGTVTADGALSGSTNGYNFISGGNATNNGSNIFVYGSTHASEANNTLFRNGSSETMRIDSSGNVGIGTSSPAVRLDVEANTAALLDLTRTGVGSYRLAISSSDKFSVYDIGQASDRLVIDSSGNVGIGTGTPAAQFHSAIADNSRTWTPAAATTGLFERNSVNYVTIEANSANNAALTFADESSQTVGSIQYNHPSDAMVFNTNSGERMRIDSSGNLLVGKTSTNTINTVGHDITDHGEVMHTTDGGTTMYLNRKTSDGTIIDLRKNGTTVGSIGASFGDLTIGTGDTGLKFYDFGDAVFPTDPSTNSNRDAAVDLGLSTVRFKDLYLSGTAYATKAEFTATAHIGDTIDMWGGNSAHCIGTGSYLNTYGPPSGGWNSGTIGHQFFSHNGTVIADIGTGGSSVNLTSKFYGQLHVDEEFRVINGDASATYFNYNNGSSNYIRGSITYVDTTLDLNQNNITDVGTLSATTKSFVIDHPTKEGMKLRYGSLEGPEDGVYVRGRLTGETVIELPDYWTGLVHEDSITVQLTAMGGKADLWVESIADNKVTVGCDTEVDCFYLVQATRKDVDAWDVEYVADS